MSERVLKDLVRSNRLKIIVTGGLPPSDLNGAGEGAKSSQPSLHSMSNPRLSAALSHKAPAKPAIKRASCAEGIKLSFSIFPADTDRLAAICAALATKGHKITNSHAVRLALRAVELDAERLAELLETMRGEDGRTRRHAKKG